MKKEQVIDNIEKSGSNTVIVPKNIPVLPTRDIVIFPVMIYPILIGRTSTMKAVSNAMENEKFIFITAQKDPETEKPTLRDIYKNGTICKIINVLRLPNNMIKVLVEGVMQGRIKKARKKDEYLYAEIEPIQLEYNDKDLETQATIKTANDLFTEYIKSNKAIHNDLTVAFENISDPLRKLYFAAANLTSKPEIKQKILEAKTIEEQYFQLASILTEELDVMRLGEEVEDKVNSSIQKMQRKFYIQEQIKALESELSDEDKVSPDITALREAIDKANMPTLAKNKAEEEFEKLKKTSQMSPDYGVLRNYIELMTQLPWSNYTKDDMNINHVKTILDEDHYDLEKPKDRILEYIAILNLTGNLKRQILCFVGPPGVGKTSLAKSIARALGRKFVRFSLGGVRDEAEIRGHRRTYIGALPGKIIQSMKKAGAVNPVILLDEIDKMANDYRGDPAAALLEVLDPEQNNNFNDHYLEVDYDLSNVLFITTANVRYDIPGPLLDRMEIIELGSYLDYQKFEIAKRHIIPKIIKEYGMEACNVKFEDDAIYKIIREYTKEAGVRNLEREIGGVLRKYAKDLISDFNEKHPEVIEEISIRNKQKEEKANSAKAKKAVKKEEDAANANISNDAESKELNDKETNKANADNKEAAISLEYIGSNAIFLREIKKTKLKITPDTVEKYLKAPRFRNKKEDLEPKVGVVTGLAWTSVGGDILPVEVNIMPGAEKLTLTGKLGDVMKESAMAAFTVVKSNLEKFGIPENTFEKKEIHIHVPEGAIPKDGPSAGITMTLALISAATQKAVRGDIAMTGEITLRGNILPIGGLNEKLLAARRAGKMTVLIPDDNLRDVDDIANEIKDGITIIPVKTIFEALAHVFAEKAPAKKPRATKQATPKKK